MIGFPKPKPRQKKPHKFKAERSVCSAGHPHPSKLEAAVCDLLLLRQRAGDIRNLKWQATVDLAFGVKWKIDWAFEQAPDWKLTYAEAKGAETRDYKLKLRMWEGGGGPRCRLEIWKGSHRRPMLFRVITPVGEE